MLSRVLLILGDGGQVMSIVLQPPSVATYHALLIASQIYDYLRITIIQNSLLSSTKVSVTVLFQQLKIGWTPLHAAFQNLASEGLIQTRPQVGSIVAEWDNTQFLEAVLIRADLEIEVIRGLAETKSDLTPLELVLVILKLTAKLDDYETFFDQYEVFHAELAHIATVPTVRKSAMPVKGPIDWQRHTMMPRFPKRSQRAFKEHIRIVEEIRSGSPSSAARAMRDHVNSV